MILLSALFPSQVSTIQPGRAVAGYYRDLSPDIKKCLQIVHGKSCLHLILMQDP